MKILVLEKSTNHKRHETNKKDRIPYTNRKHNFHLLSSGIAGKASPSRSPSPKSPKNRGILEREMPLFNKGIPFSIFARFFRENGEGERGDEAAFINDMERVVRPKVFFRLLPSVVRSSSLERFRGAL
jgi:hypothetical protein